MINRFLKDALFFILPLAAASCMYVRGYRTRFLFTSRTVPRWVILFSDAVIVLWSFAVSWLLVQRFELVYISKNNLLILISLYSAISVVVMYAMRISRGLLRYSGTMDVVRIFTSVFISSVAFLLLFEFGAKSIAPVHSDTIGLILFVNFSISAFLLVLFRMLVKAAFFYLNHNFKIKKSAALIYGSDSDAVLVKQAIDASNNAGFIIAGFIDDSESKAGAEIQQVRVYHTSKLRMLKEKYNVEKLITMSQGLDEREKKVVLEQCLDLGIHVLTVPPSDQWLYGKLKLQQLQDLKIEDLLQREPICIDTFRISEHLRDKRVLITGAAGSIGSEIVRQVLGYNPKLVIMCDYAESPLHELMLGIMENSPEAPVKLFIGDVKNYRRMHKLFDEYRPEVVFHAAAYKHVPMMEENPSEAIQTNVLGTKNLADLSIYFGAEKFVLVSTDKAVNPSNIMGASKRIAEIYVNSLKGGAKKGDIAKTRFITTRFGNVLGSNGSVIPRFTAQIQKGGPITVTHPDITRYFMTIPEAVQLVLEAGTMGRGGEIFVFDMGESVKITDLAHKMIRLAGLQPDKDVKIVYTGLRPGDKLYEELLNKGEIVMPTHHPKIRIARVISYPYWKVAQDIDELLKLLREDQEVLIVNKMKEIVPEFLSQNSKFQMLDSAGRMAG